MSNPAFAGSQAHLNPHRFLNVVTPTTAGSNDDASPVHDTKKLRDDSSRITVFPGGTSFAPTTFNGSKSPPKPFNTRNRQSKESLPSIRVGKGDNGGSSRPSRPRAMSRGASKESVGLVTRAKSKRIQKSLLKAAKPGIRVDTSVSRHHGDTPKQVFPYPFSRNGSGLGIGEGEKSASPGESKHFWAHRNKSLRSPGATRRKLRQKSQARPANMASSAPGPEHVTEGEDYFSQKKVVGEAPPIETRMIFGLEHIIPKLNQETDNGLSPATISRLDISPHDRAIFVGMTVPSDSLSDLATSPLHRRVEGASPVPITPTIVITPEIDPNKWQQFNGNENPNHEPRPTSSIYSSYSYYATPVLGLENAPPVPQLPAKFMMASQGKRDMHDPTPISVGAAVSQIQAERQPVRDSTMTLFEEDENDRSAMLDITTPTIHENDIPMYSPDEGHIPISRDVELDNTCPTPRRISRGWWNVITTPFELSRSNSKWITSPYAFNETIPQVPKVPDLSQLTKDVAQLADESKANIVSPLSTMASPGSDIASYYARDARSEIASPLSNIVSPESAIESYSPFINQPANNPFDDVASSEIPPNEPSNSMSITQPSMHQQIPIPPPAIAATTVTVNLNLVGAQGILEAQGLADGAPKKDLGMELRPPYFRGDSSFGQKSTTSRTTPSDRTENLRSPISSWTDNTPVVEMARYGSYFKTGSISSSQHIGAPTPIIGGSTNTSNAKVPTVKTVSSGFAVPTVKSFPSPEAAPVLTATPDPVAAKSIPVFDPPPTVPTPPSHANMNHEAKQHSANEPAQLSTYNSFGPRQYQSTPPVANLESWTFDPPPLAVKKVKKEKKPKKPILAGLFSVFSASKKPTFTSNPYEKSISPESTPPSSSHGFEETYKEKSTRNTKSKVGLSCLGCLRKSRRGKDDSDKKKKRRRRLIWCLLALLLLLIILGIVLGVTFGIRRESADDQSPTDVPTGSDVDSPNGSPDGPRWLNLPDMPPMPTGVATIAVPEVVNEVSGCVQPATLWSCALPKEDQESVSPNKADQPNFQVMITFQNGSEALLPDEGGNEKRTLASRLYSRLFERQEPEQGSQQTPSPPPPSLEDQDFLGNTTDNHAEPFIGEETPFFMSFISSEHTPPRHSRQDSAPNDQGQQTIGTTDFDNITDLIPPPSIARDGTAANANLLPFPSAQPLRLYNRGQPDEHYGFYTYFDRSIFLKDINGTRGSFGGNPADVDGGSTKESARLRCTWSQTRFLVQIWTKAGDTMPLLQGAGGAPPSDTPNPTPTEDSPTSTPSVLPAEAFLRPGTFPYPVTITLDRHGGSPRDKMIYCYGLDTSTRIVETQKTFSLEDRSFGGVAVNPARGPFEDSGNSGIDGGKGGCTCQWANWAQA